MFAQSFIRRFLGSLVLATLLAGGIPALMHEGTPAAFARAQTGAGQPQIVQHGTDGPYRLTMIIGPVEKMYTLAQYHKLHPKEGEIMLSGTMMMPPMSSNHMFAPHHLEVHVYNAHSGSVVTNARCHLDHRPAYASRGQSTGGDDGRN